MKKIKVPLGDNSYEILLGKGIISKLPASIGNLNKNILVVTDKNVDRLHGVRIRETLCGQDGKMNYLVLPAGEKHKTAESLNRIYSALLKHNYGRDSLIIAFGGGVVGDVAGYAAATYMRGIQYVQVPTTLLAAVDSSVGGKTAIDFNGAKNIIGAFYQPELVLIDTDFLHTLPEKEIICGAGEIVKYAFLGGEKLYRYISGKLEKLIIMDDAVLLKMIEESVKLKAAVVESDERESGLRKILNLGHTFAHAFESLSDYKISHGQAVLGGIYCAIILSEKTGLMDSRQAARHKEFVLRIRPDRQFAKLTDNAGLYAAMLKDKKNRNGKIKFVLLNDAGEIAVDVEADKNGIFETLDRFRRDIM